MKLLIATSNFAKFDIISKMVRSIFEESIEIDNLSIYPDFLEIEEVGDNVSRAKGKALNAFSQLGNQYDFVLGIDDGIIIDGVTYPAVKEHLYDLIVGDKVSVGSTIYITRAYYLVSHDGKEKYCFNKIPYVLVKKLPSLEKGGYPLNDVIAMIGENEALSSFDTNVLNEYFLKYSIQDLKELFEK